jgi:serine/threonine-protein kinase
MPDTARLTTALADRYRVERELGAGGMATVYLAKDLKHDREVALKVPRPELGEVPRPIAGLSVSRDLRHAVVKVQDYHGDAWMHRVVRP